MTIQQQTIASLLDHYPFLATFFSDEGVAFEDEPEWTLDRCLKYHTEQHPELNGNFESAFVGRLEQFVEEMLDFVSEKEECIESITILGGQDKSGNAEAVTELHVNAGEVLCIVGPTGSGKSRLLADIEWVAQGDTPTARRVLLSGKTPDAKWRFSTEHKLVAQLSQNMNFVMDLSVKEFLGLHAQSRGNADSDQVIQRIWEAGNRFGQHRPETGRDIRTLCSYGKIRREIT